MVGPREVSTEAVMAEVERAEVAMAAAGREAGRAAEKVGRVV